MLDLGKWASEKFYETEEKEDGVDALLLSLMNLELPDQFDISRDQIIALSDDLPALFVDIEIEVY